MKINVGSQNVTKIQAVEEGLQDFPEFSGAEVKGISADSGVHKQPKSMEETIQGAINRAKNSFTDCDLSFGLESGLISVPQTKSGYMDTTVCAIYDGKDFRLGCSSAFEYPKSMIDLVFKHDHDISEAAKVTGFSHDGKLGEREGMIGVLTRGKLDRKGYSKQAVMMALVQLINPEHY